MKTQISVTTENNSYDINVSASLIGSTDQFIKGMWNYKYRVNVEHNGKRTWFVYHNSAADFNAGKKELNDKDLQNALYCFLSDATAGDLSLGEFCDEFGSDEAEKSHKSCVVAREKAERLFDDIYDVYNAINELENA